MPQPLSNSFPRKRPPARVHPSSSRTVLPDRLACYMQRMTPTEVDLLKVASGKRVVRLKRDWHDVLGDLFSLGRVRMLTAGTGAFIERYGDYPSPEYSGSMAALFDETMEIRHDLTQWGHAFAVFPYMRTNAVAPECGIHFFDRAGTAMHRIFLSPSGSIEALERIAEEYGSNRENDPAEYAADNTSTNPSPLLATTVMQRSRLTGGRLLRRVRNHEILHALHDRHQERAQTRISIGNAGSIQVYRGTICSIQSSAAWTCAADGETAIYIRDAEIDQTWIMQSETEGEESLSLISFATNGRAIVTICGEEFGSFRSDHRWNHLLEGLPDV